MKNLIISYTIVVHDNPAQFGRLVTRLQNEGVVFFVHVDKKASIELFKNETAGYPNVYYTEQRWDVKWGDYSVLGAFIECLKEIRCKAPGSFIIHLSGQDYPVKSNRQIREFVEQHRQEVFMTYFSLPYSAWSGNGGLDRIYDWHFHLSGRDMVSIKPLTFTMQNMRALAKTLLRKPRLSLSLLHRFFIIRSYPLDYKVHYGGEFWMSMPEEVATRVLDLMEQRPEIEKFYKYCRHPDETLLQTIILNQGDLRIRVQNNCLKYIDWSGKRGQLPLTFTMEEKNDLHQAVKDSSRLFARKFDTRTDESVLDYIDRLIAE